MRPKYKITAKQPVFVGALLMSPGKEIESIGWPTIDLEPMNDGARIVDEYQKKYRTVPIPGALWLFGSVICGLLRL
jgi:hypothetical protein